MEAARFGQPPFLRREGFVIIVGICHKKCLTNKRNHARISKLNRSGKGLRGCSSMVEHQPSKLDTRVRFPSPAPFEMRQ